MKRQFTATKGAHGDGMWNGIFNDETQIQSEKIR